MRLGEGGGGGTFIRSRRRDLGTDIFGGECGSGEGMMGVEGGKCWSGRC